MATISTALPVPQLLAAKTGTEQEVNRANNNNTVGTLAETTTDRNSSGKCWNFCYDIFEITSPPLYPIYEKTLSKTKLVLVDYLGQKQKIQMFLGVRQIVSMRVASRTTGEW